MITYCECGHGATSHQRCLGACGDCGCSMFQKAEDQTPPHVEPDVDPQAVLFTRIAVALESIAKTLDAMRRDH